ncbi:MAG: ABC transporter ATP-binding protein [Anaerolineae bacterium]|nr:ABC transporter ATP-binding protein [Anaerolineae bacterium]
MIETHDLTKQFDGFVAVEGVNLNVEAGEVLALLGPNGAGKTTTVRMLTSILKPTRGTARVAGYDVVAQPEQVRAHVGVLTENHGLYLRMKAREYLYFFGELCGLDKPAQHRRAEELTERFGLLGALDRRLGEYSKGMRQKLALVRSMLHDPPVLLLDEPTSAMDPFSARQVRDAIAELRGDGRTIVLCTHNLPEAEELADRIAIIRRGKIIALGTELELKSELLGPPLIELQLAQNLDGVVENLSDIVQVESQGDAWLCYRTMQPEIVNPQVVQRIVSQGMQIISLGRVVRSLEEVYLRVVESDDAL